MSIVLTYLARHARRRELAGFVARLPTVPRSLAAARARAGYVLWSALVPAGTTTSTSIREEPSGKISSPGGPTRCARKK